MERWLILLQRLGKLVPQMLTALLVLVVAVAVVYEWQKPALQKLQEKDAYRYERMVDEVSGLHWINGWNQYVALKEISPAELYEERYQRWKQQWAASAEFRQNVLRQKAQVREQIKESQIKKYSFEELELEQFRRKQDPVLLRVHWEQATPGRSHSFSVTDASVISIRNWKIIANATTSRGHCTAPPSWRNRVLPMPVPDSCVGKWCPSGMTPPPFTALSVN